jgi:recombination protein RecT
MSEIAQRSPQVEVIEEIRGDEFRQQLQQALPDNVSVDQFTRATITALMGNPDLLDAKVDRKSLYLSVIKAAQIGLRPDGNEAAIVLYGNKAQLLPMVGGYRKIAAEHGWTIRSSVVYERDEFDYTTEPPAITHREAQGERGELVYAYAVARHVDGRREQRVMTRDEVLKRAKVARTDKVWSQWPAEMWAKTPVRDLFGELPMAPYDGLRLARVVEAGRLESGDAAERLYGSGLTAISPEGAAPAGGDLLLPAGVGDSEPEPGLSDDVAAGAVEAADGAAAFVPPNGKFAQGGQHGPKTLAQILELGDDGANWLRWALAHIAEPAEYVHAVWSFAQVYAPVIFQEAAARKEMS